MPAKTVSLATVPAVVVVVVELKVEQTGCCCVRMMFCCCCHDCQGVQAARKSLRNLKTASDEQASWKNGGGRCEADASVDIEAATVVPISTRVVC